MPSHSQAEIEHLLTRYGAIKFVTGWDEDRAIIGCEMQNRRLKFAIPVPKAGDPDIAVDGRNHRRTPAELQKIVAAETQRRWRALALIIKAKLEAVDSSVETFDEAFLPNICINGSQTFAEWAVPQIAKAYDDGIKMPPLLGGQMNDVFSSDELLVFWIAGHRFMFGGFVAYGATSNSWRVMDENGVDVRHPVRGYRMTKLEAVRFARDLGGTQKAGE